MNHTFLRFKNFILKISFQKFLFSDPNKIHKIIGFCFRKTIIQNQKNSFCAKFLPRRGLEPPRSYLHLHLKQARLPIPPSRRITKKANCKIKVSQILI